MESQAILAKAKLLMVTIMSQSSSIIRQLRLMLPDQVSVLEVILEEEEISCFDNILSAVTKVPQKQRRTSFSKSKLSVSCPPVNRLPDV